MSKSVAVTWFTCQRAMISYRVVLVLSGGYALAAALSLIAASFSLAEGRELRSLINLVFCFCYAGLIIVLFAINSHRKAWGVTLGANAIAWMMVMLSEAEQ